MRFGSKTGWFLLCLAFWIAGIPGCSKQGASLTKARNIPTTTNAPSIRIESTGEISTPVPTGAIADYRAGSFEAEKFMQALWKATTHSTNALTQRSQKE